MVVRARAINTSKDVNGFSTVDKSTQKILNIILFKTVFTKSHQGSKDTLGHT